MEDDLLAQLEAAGPAPVEPEPDDLVAGPPVPLRRLLAGHAGDCNAVAVRLAATLATLADLPHPVAQSAAADLEAEVWELTDMTGDLLRETEATLGLIDLAALDLAAVRQAAQHIPDPALARAIIDHLDAAAGSLRAATTTRRQS